MQAFYVACSVFGGGILVVQLVMGLAGIGHDVLDHAGHHASDGLHASEGLHLRSARALAALLTFFGLGGLLGLQLGLGWFGSLPLAVILGGAAQWGTAAALRAIGRLEQDRTVSLYQAVGQRGTVYLSVPGDRSGLGKVHVTVQERLIECQAVSNHDAIPTGSAVLVVDVDDRQPGTLVVAPYTPSVEDSDVVS